MVVFSHTTVRLSNGTKHRWVMGAERRRLCFGAKDPCTGELVSSMMLYEYDNKKFIVLRHNERVKRR